MNVFQFRLSVIWFYVIVIVVVIIQVQLEKRKPKKVRLNGMFPTLSKGDIFLPNYRAYTSSAPERWDVVVYRFQTGRIMRVGRVVGLPNETMEFSIGSLQINGVTQSLPAKMSKIHYDTDPRNISVVFPYTIPADHYFILGDNLLEAIDSRFRGSVSRKNILGRVDCK
jgi:signal peptidase I